MGKLLCEKNLRDVWCRNEGVRAEIGQILHTHTHTRLYYLLAVRTPRADYYALCLFRDVYQQFRRLCVRATLSKQLIRGKSEARRIWTGGRFALLLFALLLLRVFHV